MPLLALSPKFSQEWHSLRWLPRHHSSNLLYGGSPSSFPMLVSPVHHLLPEEPWAAHSKYHRKDWAGREEWLQGQQSDASWNLASSLEGPRAVNTKPSLFLRLKCLPNASLSPGFPYMAEWGCSKVQVLHVGSKPVPETVFQAQFQITWRWNLIHPGSSDCPTPISQGQGRAGQTDNTGALAGALTT